MKTIRTKVLLATDTKGVRIKATTCDNPSVTLGWDYEIDSDNNHAMACVALIKKMGWGPLEFVGGHTPDGLTWVVASTSLRVGGIS